MSSTSSIDCLVYRSVAGSPLSDAAIHRLVSCVLRDLGKAGEVSIHLIGEKKMRSLNRAHRGKDRATDVLSFGMEEPDFGDIFLCLPYIRRQARSFDVSFLDETRRMLIHGVLHLLGYDHEKKQDAVKMFSLQEYYLSHCV